jgi:AcrR family transcriptional regulator
MGAPRKRAYASPLRQENAEATRARIVAAATELMTARGYAATTMAEVARDAGVAVQTVYASCPGGKPALAKMVYDVNLAGDAQEVPQSGRPEVQRILDEPDPARKLALYADMATAIHRRTLTVQRILRAAAATAPADTGLHEMLAGIDRERLAGARGPAEHLHGIGALRSGLTVSRAAAQIYALTATEVFERLTETCGWSDRDYSRWLAETLDAALLPR